MDLDTPTAQTCMRFARRSDACNGLRPRRLLRLLGLVWIALTTLKGFAYAQEPTTPDVGIARPRDLSHQWHRRTTWRPSQGLAGKPAGLPPKLDHAVQRTGAVSSAVAPLTEPNLVDPTVGGGSQPVNPLLTGAFGPSGAYAQLPAGLNDIGGGIPPAAIAEKIRGTNRGQLLARYLRLEQSTWNLYGWIENSFTYNADGRPASQMNFGVFPNRLADQWMGNQYYLVLENRIVNDGTVNYGCRLDTLFGNDWQFTKSYGLFDRAFHNNQFAGLDFPQIFAEVHLPFLTRGGVDVKGGRFYSIAGFEQPPAIARPLLSVPYSMNFTPFTFLGVLTTLHLTDRINIYNGVVNGWDRWFDQSYKWGYLGGLSWVSASANDTATLSLYSGNDQLPRFPAANTPLVPTATTPAGFDPGRRNPYYNTSVREFFSAVYTHRWNEKLFEAGETDVVFDPNVPGFSTNGKVGPIAYYGLVHWFLYSFNEKVTGVWRSEIFWDPYGAATGVADAYHEMTLGLIYKPKSWLWIRPEARYDWGQYARAYADGTRNSQFTLAFDVIILF